MAELYSTGYAQWHAWSANTAIAYSAYTGAGVVMATLAAVFVYTLAPYACGSGIPEVSVRAYMFTNI